MKITINGSEYSLKYGFRTLFAYEEIAKTSFDPSKVLNEVMLFYASLLANNDDFSVEFPEFVDFLDENPFLFLDMRKWLLSELKKQSFMLQPENGDKKKAKQKEKS